MPCRSAVWQHKAPGLRADLHHFQRDGTMVGKE